MPARNAADGLGPADVVPDVQVRTVVGVFDDWEEGEAAIAELQEAGFPADVTSMVRAAAGAPPQRGAEEKQAAAGTAVGIAAGVALGGAAGLLTLVVPGIGLVTVAGTVAGTIASAVAGGALGGLGGSFADLGIPTEKAREYEAAVRGGGEFVAVQTRDAESADRASVILTRRGAREVTCYTPAL